MKIEKDILNEFVKIGYALIILFIILKIAFYNENIKTLLMVTLVFFYLFSIPGYFIMLYWKDRLGFIERITIGSGIGAAVLGLSQYFLGFFGMNIFIWAAIYPFLIIVIALLINRKKITDIKKSD